MAYRQWIHLLALSTVFVTPFLTGCGQGSHATTPDRPASEAAPHAMAGDPHSGTPVAGAKEKTAPHTAPNQVVIDNFAFQPAKLVVAAGAKVTWINRDDVPHTATSTRKPRSFDSGALDTDDQYAHVFATPGVYEYFCAVHPQMTGQIIVK